MKSEQVDVNDEAVLAGALKEFRTAARAATAHEEEFWERQRRSVLAHAGERRHSFRLRPALAWIFAAVVVLIAINLRVEGPRALPAPDLAGGFDQDLLGDVTRLIDEDTPSALSPALLFVAEIDSAEGAPKDLKIRRNLNK